MLILKAFLVISGPKKPKNSVKIRNFNDVLKNRVYDLLKKKSIEYLVNKIEIRFSFSFKCILNDAFWDNIDYFVAFFSVDSR